MHQSILKVTNKHEHCIDSPVFVDTHADRTDLGRPLITAITTIPAGGGGRGGVDLL